MARYWHVGGDADGKRLWRAYGRASHLVQFGKFFLALSGGEPEYRIAGPKMCPRKIAVEEEAGPAPGEARCTGATGRRRPADRYRPPVRSAGRAGATPEFAMSPIWAPSWPRAASARRARERKHGHSAAAGSRPEADRTRRAGSQPAKSRNRRPAANTSPEAAPGDPAAAGVAAALDAAAPVRPRRRAGAG